MEDINPTFVPRALKPIPMNILAIPKSDTKGKGRAQLPEKANSTNILDFFGKSGGWIINLMSALVLIMRLGSYSTESQGGGSRDPEEEFLPAPDEGAQ